MISMIFERVSAILDIFIELVVFTVIKISILSYSAFKKVDS